LEFLLVVGLGAQARQTKIAPNHDPAPSNRRCSAATIPTLLGEDFSKIGQSENFALRRELCVASHPALFKSRSFPGDSCPDLSPISEASRSLRPRVDTGKLDDGESRLYDGEHQSPATEPLPALNCFGLFPTFERGCCQIGPTQRKPMRGRAETE